MPDAAYTFRMDSRDCAQCGAAFVPQREHARFCGVRCRAAWNRDHMGDPLTDSSALLWSITAMSEATARLPLAGESDQARAFEAIGEAVWWVTLVDATLVRHHPGAYGAVIGGQRSTDRQLIVGILAGLRFVCNRLDGEAGLAEFIRAAAPSQGTTERTAGWTWKPVPGPALEALPPRAQAWEQRRYQAYQAHVAGRTVEETFRPAATFLTLTAECAGTLADVASAGPGG
jgi:hypothetical protein